MNTIKAVRKLLHPTKTPIKRCCPTITVLLNARLLLCFKQRPLMHTLASKHWISPTAEEGKLALFNRDVQIENQSQTYNDIFTQIGHFATTVQLSTLSHLSCIHPLNEWGAWGKWTQETSRLQQSHSATQHALAYQKHTAAGHCAEVLPSFSWSVRLNTAGQPLGRTPMQPCSISSSKFEAFLMR